MINMTNLVNKLNIYRDHYYNKNESLISDKEYDVLYDKLVTLETETGTILSNSPTQTVGYEVKSSLKKVILSSKLLSLQKTQDITEYCNFCYFNSLLMHKLDGLTIDLTYINGELTMATTRGDGEIGEDVTHNARQFVNLPIKLNPNTVPSNFKISGEAIMYSKDLESLNQKLIRQGKKPLKNRRNGASGSVRQLNSEVCKSRTIHFVVWNANDLSTNNLMLNGLEIADKLGFEVVDHITASSNIDNLKEQIEHLKQSAISKGIPIDGIVAMRNDIEAGKQLGCTSHHPRNGLAFKFYDEETLTIVTGVEWTMGKTGVLTPTVIFDPIEIDSTTVTRASVHNVNTLKGLHINIGDRIEVYKANQIIPQVRYNLTPQYKSYVLAENCNFPKVCPICNGAVEIITNYNSDKTIEVLRCVNPDCKGKLLGKLSAFVAKSAMNIVGLSESTLSKLIELNLVNNILDIYNLKNNSDSLYKLEGFKDKSISNLLNAIEQSKNTTLTRLITSLCVDGVGKSVSTEIADYCNHNLDNFIHLNPVELQHINGIGDSLVCTLKSWFADLVNINTLQQLKTILNIQTSCNKNVTSTTKLNNLNFVVTGKLHYFPNRNALEECIKINGGMIQSTVSTNTSYLINNDVTSNSGKNKKAKELNISIIDETMFKELMETGSSSISLSDKDSKVVKKSLF